MGALIDLSGKRFGKLVVIKRYGYQGNMVTWFCLCDCGKYNVVIGSNLKSGNVKSCGCYNKESATTHGQSYSPIYMVWTSMLKRCGVHKGASKRSLQDYRDRGITICPEWRKFESFYRWAKDKYHEGLVIDRINNNETYNSKNCHFTTPTKNAQNKRNSKRWFVKGVKYHSAQEAADSLNVSSSTIFNWCGRNKNYPQKEDCYAVDLY